MKNIRPHPFLIFIVVYALVFVTFLGKLILEMNRAPQLNNQSSIPTLSTSQLDKISAKIGNREKLDYPEKIDLTKINFGKIEPFSP